MERTWAGGGGTRKSADGKRRPAAGVNISALLQNREFIKITAYVLPRTAKIRVLEAMERLRWERMPDRQTRPAGGEVRLPEMTGGELVREINWRIGTLPPDDAEQVARYIRQLTRWRAARLRKRSRTHRPSQVSAKPVS